MSEFSGMHALVTGGAKGIGAAIVRRLCRAGANVVIADVDASAARSLAAELGATALLVDLTRIEETICRVRDEGPFQILVNNAGVDQHEFFTRTSPHEWRTLLGVNLEAVMATTFAVLPDMQSAGYGRIVNVSSEAGRLGSKGGAVYAAAKAGVFGFTKSIAKENARFGITVNAVAPGPVDTPLLQAAVENGGEKLLRAMESSTLVGRLGTADEVASLVSYLVSRDAAFVTGEVVGVSGGMAIR